VINEKGTTEVGGLGFKSFGFPKPLGLLELVVRIGSSEADTILDFFAGSGTTGHAVINLNRENASTGSAQAAGRRKFILVEMGAYFDTVLLPRIKKVTFSPEWKDGKPKRMATQEEAERSPRIVKVLRLESYEDALNNIEFDDVSGQQAMQFEDYLLQYMLKWETRHSETLLNVEQLAKPFSYQLHIHRDGETRAQPVDLPETFNYLLGLDVQARKVYDDNGRRYLVYRGAKRNGRAVAVIWRETEGWAQSGYERDRDFVAAQNMVEGADEVFVNGDSFIPGAQALEGLFKARMFAEVEA
jgi:adenine-specific DNA-methyltransferase